MLTYDNVVKPKVVRPSFGQNILFIELSKNLLTLYHLYCVGITEVARYKISYGKTINNEYATNGTPTGWHSICEKIGNDVPIGGVFKHRSFTGLISNPSKNVNECTRITTRILRLKGLEFGKNFGINSNKTCCDTFKRCVYIHGVNFDDYISLKKSHGCIIMNDSDILNLFNKVNELDYVLIVE